MTQKRDVPFHLRISKLLKQALRNVARKRGVVLEKEVTMKDVVMTALQREDDVMKEYGRLKRKDKQT